MIQRCLSFLALTIVLTGCSTMKDSLGMTSANVDPYMIEPQNLALPPDYKIHPPRAGEKAENSAQPKSDKAIEDVLKKS